jgi:hypothetical protein
METVRRSTSAKFIVSALGLLLCVGCGGGSGNSGPAGVPRSATVPSLDATQSAALCDWINAKLGGYGSIDNCDGGGSRHADSTQQSCIDGLSDFLACPSVTAGYVEDCINASGGDLCRVDTSPACTDVTYCGRPDGGP